MVIEKRSRPTTLSRHSQPFIVPRRQAILTFPDGHDYEGAEIHARLDVDVRTFFELQNIGEDSTAGETKTAFERFGSEIVKSWNLCDDDGENISPDAEGFLSLPPAVCIAIIGAWAEAAGTSGED